MRLISSNVKFELFSVDDIIFIWAQLMFNSVLLLLLLCRRRRRRRFLHVLF